ncbi:MAG: hypothetical protein CMJ81_14645 [Planctomycetaceae bacterium]|nr:hypothetical protein [Planctomycetaceae bacterium]MBP60883.1 hypothetical protein [Planctomycetaceae bacterium]
MQVDEDFSNDPVPESVQNQIVAEAVNHILYQNTVRKQGSTSTAVRQMSTLAMFFMYFTRIR